MSSSLSSHPSLRRTLLVWLLWPLVILVPLTAALIYDVARAPAMDALDRALTDTAVALSRIIESRDGAITLPISEQTAHALSADLVDEVLFVVSDPQGHLLGGNSALFLMPEANAHDLPLDSWHFRQGWLAGKPMRLAVHTEPCGVNRAEACTVVVAETLLKRAAAQRAALLASVMAATILALSLVALAMVAAERAMRPLHRAADQIEGLTPSRLAPVEAKDMPREVLGFVQALNRLLDRLREAAGAQRAFVADAAHQLRTPIAVMRVEAAQALAIPHPPELQPTLERLHAAAERSARLAQQLLALARAEGAAMDPALQPQRVDLATLAAGLADRWLKPALAAGQDLGFELAPAPVRGHAVLLEEALGNLIDNAVAYAGRGARITVLTGTERGTEGEVAWCAVEDDGPGVPNDEREGLWQRFRRGREAPGTGSGLGLAIVADIARLHGGRASLATPANGRGLRVTLRFPPAG